MLVVDGQAQQIDSEGTQAIIVGDGYTYLPFRAVAEACGATVDYQTGSDDSKNIYPQPPAPPAQLPQSQAQSQEILTWQHSEFIRRRI